uniref:Uncharacterized protein n=1 Tax=Asparagus officinalis TaxID=4686 RepID=Q2AA89_ASPOF|nr:hypothetical protein 17.t00029 [Asparagus officinalis]
MASSDRYMRLNCSHPLTDQCVTNKIDVSQHHSTCDDESQCMSKRSQRSMPINA